MRLALALEEIPPSKAMTTRLNTPCGVYYLYVSGSDVPPCPGSGVRGHGCRSSDYGPLGWGTASELRPNLGLRLAAHHIYVYST